jgi:hypothetical protein
MVRCEDMDPPCAKCHAMNMQFKIADLNTSIQNLIAAYPELESDEVLRADMFDAETDMNDVLSELLDRAAEAGMMFDAIAARQKELAGRKDRFAKHEENIRKLISQIMETANLKSLKLPEATLSMTYRLPRLIVSDETQLADEFKTVITTYKPNMEALNLAYNERGVTPRGTTITNGTYSLTIRRK